MNKLNFTFLLIFITAISLKSQTVVNMTTPGILRSTIKAMAINPDTIKNLKITGTVNAQDFLDIRDSIVALTTLDISGVTIVAYTGKDAPEKPFVNTTYGANELPSYSFYKATAINLTSIVLPTNLVKLGNSAFQNTKLTTLTVPGTALTTVGLNTFKNNLLLTTLTLPSTVTIINGTALSTCPLLTSFELPSSLITMGPSVFRDCTGLTNLIYNGTSLTTIGATVVQNTPLATFTVPSSAITVDTTAFQGFAGNVVVDAANANYSSSDGAFFNKNQTKIYSCPTAKTSYTIPSTVAIIGASAFYGSNLTSIAIPASVKSIYKNAFTLCTKLASVDNSAATFTSIGEYAFQKDSLLTSFTLPSTLKRIDQYAFAQSGLTSITIPASIDSIQNHVFSNCFNLQTATFDAASPLTYFGQSLFRSSRNLTTVTNLPPNMKAIPDYTFHSCSGLKNVIIPSGPNFVAIKTYAFYSCGSLTSTNIPATTKHIGHYAYDLCFALTDGCNIPATTDTIGIAAFSRSRANIVVDAANTKYSSENGILFNKNKTRLITATKRLSGIYYVPSSVVNIMQYAFYLDSLLTEITIPTSVIKIGSQAFMNCTGLQKIIAKNTTPLSGSLMGSSAFQGIDYTTCILYVPNASVSAYAAATQWKDFEQIEPIITTDIKNTSKLNATVLYPTQSKVGFYLNNTTSIQTVKVYDSNGRLLINKTLSNNGFVNCEQLAKGIYYVKTADKTQKFIKL